MRFPPRTTSALLCVLIVLLPPAGRAPHRDLERDVSAVRAAECEYRGITATFEDLTEAYVLETYQDGHLLGWEGKPSPEAPGTGSWITAWYRVGAAQPIVRAIVPDSVRVLRRAGAPRIPIIWRYSTLGGVSIDAANGYARDAVAVFRLTVDRFFQAMVVTRSAATLRFAPTGRAQETYRVPAGTVLLREGSPPPGAPCPEHWSYVRIPSSTRCGWVRTEDLRPVRDE